MTGAKKKTSAGKAKTEKAPTKKAKPKAARATGTGPHAGLRVLIVDDHEMVRYGTAQLIQRDLQGAVCEGAPDAVAALQSIRKSPPDLVIVDLSLGKGSGLELIKQINAGCPDVRVLVCSMHDERLYAERCVRAGALGYVGKQEPAGTLLAAVRQVLNGKMHLSAEMTERLLMRAGGRTGKEDVSPVELLSDRELEVFQMIGQGKTVKEIAQQLQLSPKTIEYHREHVKEKLNVASSTELTQVAVAWHLRDTWPPEDGRLS
jgi:DNA-binding NarL/FixJ family response regulator